MLAIKVRMAALAIIAPTIYEYCAGMDTSAPALRKYKGIKKPTVKFYVKGPFQCISQV